jgi:Zn-dependent protease with chaperone function
VPGFDLVVRKIVGLTSERPLRVITQGSAIEVGPRQYPQVNAIYEQVLETFDAPRRYDLFVSQNPVINAGAVGMDDPFMVLNSGTVTGLEEAQLRSVIGHEVAHIMSGHVLYKTMLRMMLRAGLIFFRMPITGLALLGVLAALLEWDRKSELSADRASLLACQDPDVVRGALLRVAGGVGEGASVEAFREQARRFEESGNALDSVLKVLAMLRRRHPFPVQRIGEIDRWIEGGEYDKIIGGDYPRREDDPEEKNWSNWKDTADTYKDGFKTSSEPFSNWVKSTSEDVAKGANAAFDFLFGKDEEVPQSSEEDDSKIVPFPDAARDSASEQSGSESDESGSESEDDGEDDGEDKGPE